MISPNMAWKRQSSRKLKGNWIPRNGGIIWKGRHNRNSLGLLRVVVLNLPNVASFEYSFSCYGEPQPWNYFHYCFIKLQFYCCYELQCKYLCFPIVLGDPCEKCHPSPQWGRDPQAESHWLRVLFHLFYSTLIVGARSSYPQWLQAVFYWLVIIKCVLALNCLGMLKTIRNNCMNGNKNSNSMSVL